MMKNRAKNSNVFSKMTMNGVDDGNEADDDMSLALPSSGEKKKDEEKGETIRQLRDENGRLFKLLAEKDFEAKQLRKKWEAEKEKNADLGISKDSKIVGSDVVATKIVDLSRKNRELTCDVESEKNKSRQLSMKLRETENEVRRLKEGGDESHKKSVLKVDENPEDVIRTLQDKLSSSNTRLMESKAQLEEKKMATSKFQRALEKELGSDSVNLQAILAGNSNWQGRAQKIINLQNKVAELNMKLQRYEGQFSAYASMDQSRIPLPPPTGALPPPPAQLSKNVSSAQIKPEELDYDMEDEFDDGFPSLPSTAMSSASTIYRQDARGQALIGNNNNNKPPLPPPSIASARAINENKQYAMIKKLERERKEALERLGEELKASEGEKDELNKKMESMKARIRVLSLDLKAAKTQISTLLEKGKHDDELVQALMGQLNSMKDIVDDAKKDKGAKESLLDKENKEKQTKMTDQERKIAEMETVVADREHRIAKLQDQIIDLQKNMMANQTNSPSTSAATERLGSLFISDPEAVPAVTLPPIFPSDNASSSSSPQVDSSPASSTNRRPSRIPSTTRRRSGESRSRCKSRVDRPLSSNAAQEKSVDEMKAEIQELRHLGRAAEVERDRLMQLLSINEDRNAKETREKVALITKLQEAQRKTAKLEKDMERHQLKLNRDSTFVYGSPGDALSAVKSASVVSSNRKANSGVVSGYSSKRGVKAETTASSAVAKKSASTSESDKNESTIENSHRNAWGDDDDVVGDEKDAEYLEMRISSLLSENDVLQKTLEATLASKKQDLTLLQEMMTQTKGIFLKAMKELKGG